MEFSYRELPAEGPLPARQRASALDATQDSLYESTLFPCCHPIDGEKDGKKWGGTNDKRGCQTDKLNGKQSLRPLNRLR